MTFQKLLGYLEYLLIIPIAFGLVTLPFIVVFCVTVYVLVYIISCFITNYGKFLNFQDVWHDEDIVNSVPQSTLVFSLILRGDLSLEKLRSVFIVNVLNARSKVNPQKLRYPELMQYVSTFICFRIWKWDPSFNVENHIEEKNWNGADLETIHEKYQNKPYEKDRSPWELTLFRNVNFKENLESESNSLLIFRVHHTMLDAKSMLKLLVECLGNKSLNTSSPQKIQKDPFGELKFMLSFPFKFTMEIKKLLMSAYNSFQHPWKLKWCFKSMDYQGSPTLVAFSPKISMSNLKQVANEQNVETSAVVMSIIAGAIRKACGNKWNKEVAIGYLMPKPNHPEYLTNHHHTAIMCLPTGEECMIKRVQECNKEFVRVKKEQLERCMQLCFFMGGIQVYPISRFVAVNHLIPIGVVNIAGEEEGFSAGDAECVDFRMSAGTISGAAGVMFCCISYKDDLSIAVIAKESVLTKDDVKGLANDIESELQLLMKIG